MLYDFPPFAMLPHTLLRVCTQSAEVVLLALLWQAQSWFPGLLELSVDWPRLLPSLPTLLGNPVGDVHPLLWDTQLGLVAWLSASWLQEPGNRTDLLGESGAWQGTWIPLLSLSS